MKRFLCSVVLLFALSTAFSQKIYFVYVQSESDQPFWVRIGDKVNGSNSIGYLVLPKMSDSTYTLRVGFPNNKYPEQTFQVAIGGKDRGFLLKNFGDKGWGLFDLQSLNVTMAELKEKPAATATREVSLFTETLSKAANDPTLKEKTIFIREEEKPTVPQLAVVKETEPVKQAPPPVVINDKPKPAETKSEKQETPVAVVKQTPPVVQPEIRKDTMAIVVNESKPAPLTAAPPANEGKVEPEKVAEKPVEKPAAQEPVTKPVDQKPAEQKPVDKPVVTPEGIATSTQAEAKREEPKKEEPKKEEIKKEEPKVEPAYERSIVTRRSESSTTEGFGIMFIDVYEGKQDTVRIMIPNPKTPYVKPVDMPKADVGVKELKVADTKAAAPGKTKFADCKSVATEADFIGLRRRMAAQNGDENMIKESRKGFKAKCFTTAQIRNLGNLFLNEASKFQFYEGAYPFVSDREAFSSLQSDFKDNYFIYRFKNLIN